MIRLISEAKLLAVLDQLKKSSKLGMIETDSYRLSQSRFLEVSCLINKYEDDQTKGKEFQPNYLIHKNTLGQMMYEAFIYKQEEFNQYFTPAVIVLSNQVVEGVKTPGIYYFDACEEKYIWQGAISNNLSFYFRNLKDKYELNSDLIIGYFAKKPCLQIPPKELMNILLAGMDRFAHLLSLHGGLKEWRTIDVFHPYNIETEHYASVLNLLCIFQWIQEINHHNHTEFDQMVVE